MKIGICDENRNTVRDIRVCLQKQALPLEIDEIAAYTLQELQMDLEEAAFNCDVLIINTNFPKGRVTGVDIVRTVNQFFSFCKVIYVSENAEHISDMYETEHCYFFPIRELEQHLVKAVTKAVSLLKRDKQAEKTEIICDGHHVFLRKADVVYVEKKGRKLSIFTRQREFNCYSSLTGLQKSFERELVRAHGSYLVNCDYITYMGTDYLEVITDKRIPIGRTYGKNLKNAYCRNIEDGGGGR